MRSFFFNKGRENQSLIRRFNPQIGLTLRPGFRQNLLLMLVRDFKNRQIRHTAVEVVRFRRKKALERLLFGADRRENFRFRLALERKFDIGIGFKRTL